MLLPSNNCNLVQVGRQRARSSSMPRMSPGLAKNTIRRALRAIVDPEPRKPAIAHLWDYFKSSCAYCGRSVQRDARGGHVDHLVHDGPNHVSNRVLSCPTCNGDEKREGRWLDFLRKKAKTRRVFEARKRRIEAWVSSQRPSKPVKFDAMLLQREIGNTVRVFDRAAVRLRRSKVRG